MTEIKQTNEETLLGIDLEHPVFRIDGQGIRYYYQWVDEQVQHLSASVTSITDMEVPKGEGFYQWQANMGYEEAKAYATQESYYGTVLDILWHKYLAGKNVSLHEEDLRHFLVVYLQEQEGLDLWEFPQPLRYWPKKLQGDLVGLRNFANDYQYEPLIIQQAMIHEEQQYAGAVDDVGYLTAPNNRGNNEKGERDLSLLDLKKKAGKYDSRALQLVAYLDMVQGKIDEKITRVLNVSPARNKQGYTLNEITKIDYWQRKWGNYLDNFLLDNHRPNDVTQISGELADPEITTIPIEDYLKQQHTEYYQEEQD